jgi:hypothetical protein
MGAATEQPKCRLCGSHHALSAPHVFADKIKLGSVRAPRPIAGLPQHKFLELRPSKPSRAAALEAEVEALTAEVKRLKAELAKAHNVTENRRVTENPVTKKRGVTENTESVTKKRGRPAKVDGALSDAERARRAREKKKLQFRG